jgi:hypothetical protein
MKAEPDILRLGRNFLHAAKLEFAHPLTGKPLDLEASLPEELAAFLKLLEADATSAHPGDSQGSGTKVPTQGKSRIIARIKRR